ncbi:50S ribosomal protein L24 [Candidatus Woesearchaeota archaeon]|nr:50S ribosomal protein L24 [Candidatus Woesearchaeota archaeon]
MKDWSAHWKASAKPGKQRKYVAKAPAHTAGKFLHSHLSKELRQKLKIRAMRVRKGDKVKITRGEFRGKTGAVESVDTTSRKVYVTGVDQPKRDGSKALYPLACSNLIITELQPDKHRLKAQP